MKRIFCIFITIAIVLLVSLPVSAQETEQTPTTTGTISGRALYDGGNTPVIGATIILMDHTGEEIDSVRSTFDGKYIFENVSEGVDYKIEGCGRGIPATVANITVVAEETTIVDVPVLSPELSLSQHKGNRVPTVYINGAILICHTPVIENNRALVPMRALFEALNAEIKWDGDTQIVTAIMEDKTIVMQIGKPEISVNGEVKALDVSPQIVRDRTFVPARAVCEELGASVGWSEKLKIVSITFEIVFFMSRCRGYVISLSDIRKLFDYILKYKNPPIVFEIGWIM